MSATRAPQSRGPLYERFPMNKTMLLDKYPVFTTEIAKSDTECLNVDDVLARLYDRIEAHPIASYVGEFDHHGHVAAQAEGEIAEGIQGAKHILFCVANAILNPLIGAVRPRAISVTEMADRFVISYLEAPKEKANTVMAEWVGSLKNA